MTGFLDHVENNLSEYAGVEFECIHNQELVKHLEKRGYIHGLHTVPSI
ncbi:hypothetical protein ACXHQ0_16855 [Vibrio antiquarius]|uniref:Uncharacterized protein n=2 Tax=Vibrio parahaemolyticus TaxID=670 RepID=A0AA46Z9R0_VIBPH|nr:hypothetical protein [Vibrio parahaemolyticus]UYV29965.1 hypothetical protein M5598_28685 [Vibrio parahaemolyticus]